MVTPHLPEQLISAPDHFFGKKKNHNMQHDPPLIELEAIPSSPAATYMGEETDPQLTTASCQAVVESDNISPESHPD